MPDSNPNRIWPRLAVAVALLVFTLAIWLWMRPSRDRYGAASPGTSPTPAAPGTANASRKPDVSHPTAAEGLDGSRVELEEARAVADPRQRARAFGEALQRWIARDLEAALAYLRTLPRGAEFSQGLRMIIDAVGRRDPERALALARELVTTRDDQAIYSELFDRMARENLAGATGRLALVPPGVGRENAIRAVADAWVRSDPAAALAWAQQLTDASDRTPALETVLRELAAKDPSRAIEFAQKTLQGPALERTVFEALRSLAASDPREASGLVHFLPAGEMQTMIAADVARFLAAQDVEAAAAWANSLPAGTAQWLALNTVLARWGANDPVAAGRYVSTLPPGQLRHGAAVYLASVWGGAQPQAALNWAATLPAENTRPVAVTNIVSAWAQREPEAATRWAAGQLPGSLLPAALNGALSYWLLQDAPAVQAFVRTLTGESQAQAAGAIAPGLAQQDPLATMTWGETLSSSAARASAQAAAFARWRQNAPAAAEAWLNASSLPPETKAKLLRR